MVVDADDGRGCVNQGPVPVDLALGAAQAVSKRELINGAAAAGKRLVVAEMAVEEAP